eukprot:TRINITY_DN2494_c0_g1_i1.p1 TRINITY_DN2494_c0_g1~~TRINITY_DN2494_c0_g1_i1.p1  ORF type:complete len:252 (-),score=7.39 TRINITY_DN2494_c0_g1_i1:257-1012(-)
MSEVNCTPCPICNLSISSKDLERHVNHCIDEHTYARRNTYEPNVNNYPATAVSSPPPEIAQGLEPPPIDISQPYVAHPPQPMDSQYDQSPNPSMYSVLRNYPINNPNVSVVQGPCVQFLAIRDWRTIGGFLSVKEWTSGELLYFANGRVFGKKYSLREFRTSRRVLTMKQKSWTSNRKQELFRDGILVGRLDRSKRYYIYTVFDGEDVDRLQIGRSHQLKSELWVGRGGSQPIVGRIRRVSPGHFLVVSLH